MLLPVLLIDLQMHPNRPDAAGKLTIQRPPIQSLSEQTTFDKSGALQQRLFCATIPL